MKKRWQEARRAAGLPADKPNIVVSHVAQVCWQKVRCGLWCRGLRQLGLQQQLQG